jgi:hypothetical protein
MSPSDRDGRCPPRSKRRGRLLELGRPSGGTSTLRVVEWPDAVDWQSGGNENRVTRPVRLSRWQRFLDAANPSRARRLGGGTGKAHGSRFEQSVAIGQISNSTTVTESLNWTHAQLLLAAPFR